MLTPFIQVIGSCDYEPCDCTTLKNHGSIDFGLKGSSAMTSHDFVAMITRWMISKKFLDHYLKLEDKLQSCIEKDKEKAEYGDILDEARAVVMRYTLIEKTELTKAREWKDYVIDNWCDGGFCTCKEVHTYHPCDVHNDPDNEALKGFMTKFQDVIPNLEELLRTDFEREHALC